MNQVELSLLYRSAKELDSEHTGWIVYNGGDISRINREEIPFVESLIKAGLVTTEISWGMAWYKINICALIKLFGDYP